jgi:ABC-type Fe3+-citrate transport system substrate-binding protein
MDTTLQQLSQTIANLTKDKEELKTKLATKDRDIEDLKTQLAQNNNITKILAKREAMSIGINETEDDRILKKFVKENEKKKAEKVEFT